LRGTQNLWKNACSTLPLTFLNHSNSSSYRTASLPLGDSR
jgi:hypothetical protein